MPFNNPATRRRKFILLGATMFALVVLSVVLALRSTGLELELAKIRASGHPASIEDLNTWYPAVAAESNAALGVLAAAELKNQESSPSLKLPKRGEESSSELLSDLEQYVTNNTATLAALRTALQLPDSRYPLILSRNTIATALPNPNLAEIKGLAQLLHYQTLHLVSGGNAEAAFAPVHDGFALAATLRNEPFLISELVRIASVAIALRSLECALPAGKFTDPELRTISEWLTRTEADAPRSWHRAIIAERVLGLEHFNTVNQTASNPNSALEHLVGTLYRGLGFHDRDLRMYLEIMARFSTAMTNSFPAAYQLSIAIDKELNRKFSSGLTRFAILSKAIMPAIIKASGKEAALVTNLRCARTAVAIERYRLANNGALPDTLEQLIPTYLPTLPRDGAKGDPLQFERIQGGYQISSPAAARILDNKTSTTFPVVHLKLRKN